MMIEISELLPHDDRANLIKKCFAVLQEVLEAPDQKPEQRRRTAETILHYLLPRARQPGMKTQEVAKENKRVITNADRIVEITRTFVYMASQMVNSAFKDRQSPDDLAKVKADLDAAISKFQHERTEAYGEIRAFMKPRNSSPASS